MIVIVGAIVVLGAVLAGFTWAGGHVGALIHPSEIVTIGGAALGALIVMSYHDLYVADPGQGWPALDASRFIDQIVAGVRSSCTYAGAANLEEFHERALVGLQSTAGYAEGRPLHTSW